MNVSDTGVGAGTTLTIDDAEFDGEHLTRIEFTTGEGEHVALAGVMSVEDDFDDGEDVATDGGAVASAAEPTPRKAVVAVLEDARPGGLDREDLLARAAAVGRTTRADIKDAIERLRKRGEIYNIDERFKLVPSREVGWGGSS